VNRELEAKGLKRNPANPDFLIALYDRKEKKVDDIYYKGFWKGFWGAWRGLGNLWPRYLQRVQYEGETLILDFVDPQTKEVFWRVAATHEVISHATSEKKAEQINRIVPKMLKEFPPR
jgi:hypothetical protein